MPIIKARPLICGSRRTPGLPTAGPSRSIPTAITVPATGLSFRDANAQTFLLQFARPAHARFATASARKWSSTSSLDCADPEKSLEKGAVLPGPARRQAHDRVLQEPPAGHGPAIRPEPGNPLEGFAGRFQAASCSTAPAKKTWNSLLARRHRQQSPAPFEGIIPILERLYTESESEFTRTASRAL